MTYFKRESKKYNNMNERNNNNIIISDLQQKLYYLKIDLEMIIEINPHDCKKQIKKINKQIAKVEKEIDFYTERNHSLVIEYNFGIA